MVEIKQKYMCIDKSRQSSWWRTTGIKEVVWIL